MKQGHILSGKLANIWGVSMLPCVLVGGDTNKGKRCCFRCPYKDVQSENFFLKCIVVWSVLLSILVMPAHSSAQPEQPLPPGWHLDYEFINYRANQIQQFGGGSLAGVFEQLFRLETDGDEQVHILQIGDSHIQADIFSGQVRKKFLQDPRFPMSARGLVFPYSAARTNNPYNYSTRYSGAWKGERSVKSRDYSIWGISGISLETYDQNATIRLNPNLNGLEFFTNKVKILHPNLEGQSFEPVVRTTTGNALIGKFVTDGATEYVFEYPLQQIEIGLSQNAGRRRFIMQGVLLENMSPGVTYSAVGVNSADAGSFMRCDDFERNIALIKPDLVIVSLGTNDAYMYRFDASQFKRNLLKMVVRIRQGHPEANILFTTPADNLRRRRYQNKNNALAVAKMKEVASELNLAVWDLYEVMGGLGSIEAWYKAGLAQRDRLHFTGKGYKLQGELLYQALMEAYAQFKAQRMGK